MDQFFFAKMAMHIQIVREKAKNMTKTAKSLQKGGVFTISEMRELSKQEFPNGGIPPNRNFKMEGSLLSGISIWREVTLLQFFARNVKLLSMLYQYHRDSQILCT